jgi:DNA-binding transcriptional LysR family regulator
MRTRHIEIFHAIYAAGSISQAAHILNVSQPALSKALKQAEEEIGFALFERSAQGLVPTHEANELYAAASRVLAELNAFQAAARTVQLRQRSAIRFAMAPSIGLSIGADAVAAFARQHPSVNLHIQTLHYDDVVRALREETIDLAVMYQPTSQRGLRILPLFEAQFVCLAAKGTVANASDAISVDELKQHRVIHLSTQAPLGQLLSQHIDRHNYPDSRLIVANTYYLAQSMAERGLGIAIVDEYAARAANTAVVDVLKLDIDLRFSVGAVLRDGHSVSSAESDLLACFEHSLSRSDPHNL